MRRSDPGYEASQPGVFIVLHQGVFPEEDEMPTYWAPDVFRGERIVYSSTDVNALEACEEIDAVLANKLRGGFAYGRLKAARLVAFLSEDAPLQFWRGLQIQEELEDFVRARFRDVIEVQEEHGYESERTVIYVTVTTKLEGAQREDLAARIHAALLTNLPVGTWPDDVRVRPIPARVP